MKHNFLRSYCKLNLFLDIGKKEKKTNLHNIQSLVHIINLFDEIRIKKIIELILAVSITEFLKTFIEKLFFDIDKTIEPIAPIEAASVGVAIPVKIEPRTKKIRIIGNKIIFKVFIKLYFLDLLLIIGGA